MKKQLLLMLTVLSMVFIGAFSASAAPSDCDHAYVPMKYEAPTCEDWGRTLKKCGKCEEEYWELTTAPLGHEFSDNYTASADENYFVKKCTRCDKTDGKTYYQVSFYNNGKLRNRCDDVKYAVVAKDYKNELMYTTYVEAGQNVRYQRTLPTTFSRAKDKLHAQYKFSGWTIENDVNKLYTPSDSKEYDPYLELGPINGNTNYYTRWQGVDADYEVKVYNSDGKQLLLSQTIPHGGKISYNYTYPDRDSTTGYDYEFLGWSITSGETGTTEQLTAVYSTPIETIDGQIVIKYTYGQSTGEGANWSSPTKTETDKNGNEVEAWTCHIKEVPLYGNVSIIARHKENPRSYYIQLCDAKGNPVGAPRQVKYSESILTDGETMDAYVPANDDEYTYSYQNRWQTLDGDMLFTPNCLSVKNGSLDFDDPIRLRDVNGKVLKDANGVLVTLDGIGGVSFQNYYNDNLRGIDGTNYYYPMDLNGNLFTNDMGRTIAIRTTGSGINYYAANEGITEFKNDAADICSRFRAIKVKPLCNSAARTYDVLIKIDFPDSELSPEDYISSMGVQFETMKGQLILGTYTVDKETAAKKTSAKALLPAVGGEKSAYISVQMTKYSQFRLNVTSKDGKYRINRVYNWDEIISPEAKKQEKLNIIVVAVDEDYIENMTRPCSCICHTVFRGLWVRVLNIIYSIAKKKVVCCDDMYATLGGALKYGP